MSSVVYSFIFYIQVEYFVASDAAAIIEHTKQVLFLEDDDVAFVEDGGDCSCDI